MDSGKSDLNKVTTRSLASFLFACRGAAGLRILPFEAESVDPVVETFPDFYG